MPPDPLETFSLFWKAGIIYPRAVPARVLYLPLEKVGRVTLGTRLLKVIQTTRSLPQMKGYPFIVSLLQMKYNPPFRLLCPRTCGSK